MRIDDIRHYLLLRRIVERPWSVARFRKRAKPGERLEIRFLDGRRLCLIAGESDYHVFRELFLDDIYRLGRLPADLDLVVDVGANVGLFAFRAAALARRVVCYEPAVANFGRLEENLADCTGVESVRAAVAGASGALPLYRPAGAKTGDLHSLHPRVGGVRGATREEVAATTLDELFVRHKIERCDLLKIDVEGGEYEILRAASAATLARVRRLYCEYHDLRPRTPENRPAALVRLLRDHGFEVETVAQPRAENLGMIYAERPAAPAG